MRLDLHLHHLQRTPQDPAEDIRVPQLILRPPNIRQLNEVRQRVLFEDQGELLAITRPIRNRRRDVQEDFESNLLPSALSISQNSSFNTNLRDHLSRLLEIRAPFHGIRLREIVFDQSEADVVTHLVQLLVDFHVIALVVFA
jgi:hypothetical protein